MNDLSKSYATTLVVPHPEASLQPITLLANGERFKDHVHANSWLGERGLTGNMQIKITYNEWATVDSAHTEKIGWVLLRSAVTPGFLRAHQSVTSLASGEIVDSPRHGWNYPHREGMKVHFSALTKNSKPIDESTLRELKTGVPPGYQGTADPVIMETNAEGHLISEQTKTQWRLITKLYENFEQTQELLGLRHDLNSFLHRQFTNELHNTFSLLKDSVDPSDIFVNHFVTDAHQTRTLTGSQTLAQVVVDFLETGVAPVFDETTGFFNKADSVASIDNFPGIPAVQGKQAIATIISGLDPRNLAFRNKLLSALDKFWNTPDDRSNIAAPDTNAEKTFANLLAKQLHTQYDLLNELATADGQYGPTVTAAVGKQQLDAGRERDIISSHSSQSDRIKLATKPTPQVFTLRLTAPDSDQPIDWPGTFLINTPGKDRCTLVSPEYGIQIFKSFSELQKKTTLTRAGVTYTLHKTYTQIEEDVFKQAAQQHVAAEEKALTSVYAIPDLANADMPGFLKNLKNALSMTALSIDGPLEAREEALREEERDNHYKMATEPQKADYRRLEQAVFDADKNRAQLIKDIPHLDQYAKDKLLTELKKAFPECFSKEAYPQNPPDPDKTVVSFKAPKTTWHTWMTAIDRAVFGDPSYSMTLTELMLYNLPWKATTPSKDVVELQPAMLSDRDGTTLVHRVTGYPIILTTDYLQKIVTRGDIDKNYGNHLKEKLQSDTPESRAIAAAAHVRILAGLKLTAFDAALKGDKVFKATVTDSTVYPHQTKKLVPLWLDTLAQSPNTQKRPKVQGKDIHVYRLIFGYRINDDATPRPQEVNEIFLFSDHKVNPDTKGATIGIYFPDSPDVNDLHEISKDTTLKTYLTDLLKGSNWQNYFARQIPLADTNQIKRILGTIRGEGPEVEVVLIDGDFIEQRYRASVTHQITLSNHRAKSNEEVTTETTTSWVHLSQQTLSVFAAPLEGLGILGLRTTSSFHRAASVALSTGKVPGGWEKSWSMHMLARDGRRILHRIIPARHRALGKSSSGQASDNSAAGAPLINEVYGRYAVDPDTAALIRASTSPDASGFYRRRTIDATTGKQGETRIYIGASEGPMYRVHGNTRLGAVDAQIVDPMTGVKIRNSDVLRDTVALVDGKVRGVGFGLGGGKRKPAAPDDGEVPGPSRPRPDQVVHPAVDAEQIANEIRTPGNWNNRAGNIAVSTAADALQRNILLIDQSRSAAMGWSVLYRPGQPPLFLPSTFAHPDWTLADVRLRSLGGNHWQYWDPALRNDANNSFGNWRSVSQNTDAFYAALSEATNQGPSTTASVQSTAQSMRDTVANYVAQHPNAVNVLTPHRTDLQRAFFESGHIFEQMMSRESFVAFSELIHGDGSGNPQQRFSMALTFLVRNMQRNQLIFAAPNEIESVSDTILPVLNHQLPTEMRLLIANYIQSPSSGPGAAIDLHQTEDFLRHFLLPRDTPEAAQALHQLLTPNAYLSLTPDVRQLMMEYAVTAEQLLRFHPRTTAGFEIAPAGWQGGTHNAQGVRMVARTELLLVGNQLLNIDQSLTIFIQRENHNAFRYLFLDVLRHDNLPDAVRRAQFLGRIMSTTHVVSAPFQQFRRLERALNLSGLPETRLAIIQDSRACLSMAVSIFNSPDRSLSPYETGFFNLAWTRSFDDANLSTLLSTGNFYTEDYTWYELAQRLQPQPTTGNDNDWHRIAALFTSSGGLLSQSRMRVILENRNAVSRIMAAISDDTRLDPLWRRLIDPKNSDVTIQDGLQLVASSNSRATQNFEAALRTARNTQIDLIPRINRILYTNDADARALLAYFNFPLGTTKNQTQHTRAAFVTALETDRAFPAWAWQHLRPLRYNDPLAPYSILKTAIANRFPIMPSFNNLRLEGEALRINQSIVQASPGWTQTRAAQFLHFFDFQMTPQAGHTPADLAIYINANPATEVGAIEIPVWAWQHLRQGFTRAHVERWLNG